MTHLQKLQNTPGAKFAVERTRTVASGKHVRETNWTITEVTPHEISFFRPEAEDRHVAKTVSHETFAEWQFNWLALMEKRVAKKAPSTKLQPQVRMAVHEENGVTAPIQAIYEAWIRLQTGV